MSENHKKKQTSLANYRVDLLPVTALKSNGYRIYVNIMTGENWRQFRLLTSFIGQFVHTVGGEGVYGGGGVSI